MAEQVQATLDGMVEALADLRDRNIFSASEIHAIVERRRRFEYLLRRPQARVSDHERYLADETLLERLRDIRTKKAKKLERKQQRSSQDKIVEKRPGDTHVKQFIRLLWKRTLRKFRAHLDLHWKYAQYLRDEKYHSSANFRLLSDHYARMLRVFSRRPDVWIAAASHEMFRGGSIRTARTMLQRGLRINPERGELWVQAFVLELHAVQRLTGRAKILSGGDATDTNDNSNSNENSKDGSKEARSQQQSHYYLAKLVHDHAIEALPDSVDLRIQLLQQTWQFPSTSELRDHIWKALRRDCINTPDAWKAVCLAVLQKQQNEDITEGDGATNSSDAEHEEEQTTNMVTTILAEAAKAVPTKEMHVWLVRFVIEHNLTDQEESFLEQVFGMPEGEAVSSWRDELMLLKVNWLANWKDDKNSALQAIVSYAPRTTHAAVWTNWAHLVEEDGPQAQYTILKRALDHIPVHDKSNHTQVLLEIFGFMVQQNDKNLLIWFERLLVLSAGDAQPLHIDEPVFGVGSAVEAYVEYLVVKKQRLKEFRAAYSKILFRSSLLDNVSLEDDGVTVSALFDIVIEVETERRSCQESTSMLERVFCLAVRFFGETPTGDSYRRRLQDMRYGSSNRMIQPRLFAVPVVDASVCQDLSQEVHQLYDRAQIVRVVNIPQHEARFTASSVAGLFENLNAKDKDTFNVEREAVDNPLSFFQDQGKCKRAYCSFIVQHDKEALSTTLARLPFDGREFGDTMVPSEAVWFFFGRNAQHFAPLPGRPEHTDSISFDGTWHFQLSGSKTWHVRPTEDLRSLCTVSFPRKSLKVVCKEGDILVINTRMWFHRTTIPAQSSPSVSYARDFSGLSGTSVPTNLSNVQGTYATEAIPEGTVLFTENDMPDASLHRSADNPNCELVEMEDGVAAVVASRNITTGEFFCLEESSSDKTKRHMPIDPSHHNHRHQLSVSPMIRTFHCTALFLVLLLGLSSEHFFVQVASFVLPVDLTTRTTIVTNSRTKPPPLFRKDQSRERRRERVPLRLVSSNEGESNVDEEWLKKELLSYVRIREEQANAAVDAETSEPDKTVTKKTVGGTRGNPILDFVSAAPVKERIVTKDTKDILDYDELTKYGYGNLVTPIMKVGGRFAVYRLLGWEEPPSSISTKPKTVSAASLILDPADDPTRYSGLKLGQILDDEEQGKALEATLNKGNTSNSTSRAVGFEKPFADKRNVGPRQTPDWTPEQLDEWGKQQGRALAWARRAKEREFVSDPDELFPSSLTASMRVYSFLTATFGALAWGKASSSAATMIWGDIADGSIQDFLQAPAYALLLAAAGSAGYCALQAPEKKRSTVVWGVKGLLGGPLAVARLRSCSELVTTGEKEARDKEMQAR